jgi:hypothetical protein
MGTLSDDLKQLAIAGDRTAQLAWLSDEIAEFTHELAITDARHDSSSAELEALDVLGVIAKFFLPHGPTDHPGLAHGLAARLRRLQSADVAFLNGVVSNHDAYDKWAEKQASRGRTVLPQYHLAAAVRLAARAFGCLPIGYRGGEPPGAQGILSTAEDIASTGVIILRGSLVTEMVSAVASPEVKTLDIGGCGGDGDLMMELGEIIRSRKLDVLIGSDQAGTSAGAYLAGMGALWGTLTLSRHARTMWHLSGKARNGMGWAESDYMYSAVAGSVFGETDPSGYSHMLSGGDAWVSPRHLK